ncbi:MAG: hypothetical protein H8E18_04540 [FCB group bacterium]|nr:hypothetical protein [FCB group bacterium]
MRISQKIDFEFSTSKKLKLPGRVPIVSRMMALAHFYDHLLQSRILVSISDIGRLEGVTQQRISQIMSLLLLAPEIQESLLTLPIQLHGNRSLPTEKMIQIAKEIDFDKQITLFQTLL